MWKKFNIYFSLIAHFYYTPSDVTENVACLRSNTTVSRKDNAAS
jgi:aspartyl/asparaginyl beta-hydroxylase (cupin superfamily)